MGIYESPTVIGVRILEKRADGAYYENASLQFDASDWLIQARITLIPWLQVHARDQYIIQTKHTAFSTYTDEQTSFILWKNNRAYGSIELGLPESKTIILSDPELV
jgi:hypothetical protein